MSACRLSPSIFTLSCGLLFAAGMATAAPFGIRVVDEATGRGVPLMTLRTVHHVSAVTDSAGWVAFDEPGLMDRPVFFTVSGPGYAVAEDGFGFAGVRLTPRADEEVEIRVMRLQPAQRLYRITGAGVYRDSSLLGKEPPLPRPLFNAGVLGQDSVQAVPFQDRLFWLWGDTLVPQYPLGNFHATGAWSDLPNRGGLDPQYGIHLDYLQEAPDKIRPLLPSDEPGMVWLFGLTAVKSESGERLLAHFGRYLSLTERAEHGVAEFMPEQERFFPRVVLGEEFEWQHPDGQSVTVEDPDGTWVYFANPFCTVRVPADADTMQNPASYEALTWDADARDWTWQSTKPPVTQKLEKQWLKAGLLPAAKSRLQLTAAQDQRSLTAHGASVRWNDYRQRWVLLFVERGAPESVLGEVWYAESEAITGPWGPAVKVASHPNYSFYNPTHHSFFDQEGGRVIYFEGTYSQTFSGNPQATPRYDYNQILYRLELDDERLRPAQP